MAAVHAGVGAAVGSVMGALTEGCERCQGREVEDGVGVCLWGLKPGQVPLHCLPHVRQHALPALTLHPQQRQCAIRMGPGR